MISLKKRYCKRSRVLKVVAAAFITLILFSCSLWRPVMKSDLYSDISAMFSVREFEKLKIFVLQNGDRKTYNNMYNDNPHYRFAGFDLYLSPVKSNTSELATLTQSSDFDELVIFDYENEIQYYHIFSAKTVNADKALLHGITPDMVENRVYLLNIYNKNIDTMVKNLKPYLEQMKHALK